LKAKNRSPKTISWYLDILRRFFAFVENRGPAKPLGQLGMKDVEAYLLYLQKAARWENHPRMKPNGGLSPYSIRGHVRAIKVFFSWLADEGYIEYSPLVKFPLPKVPKNLMPTLSLQQLKPLFDGLDRSTLLGARSHCVLALLLDTGLRISELVNIKMSDFDPMMTCLKVKGKGQKERLVPISKADRKELIKYTQHHRHSLCEVSSDYLFPARDGDHISINSVQQAMRRLAKKVGLNGVEVHPHVFRHTFATMYLQKGGQSLALKEILGHESFQTTQKYVHLQPEYLMAQHAQHSPLAELLEK
jgi:site-specific recombinase XerD